MTSGIATLACLLAFLGVVWWAYGGRRRERFDAAARIPLEDDGQSEDPPREQCDAEEERPA